MKFGCSLVLVLRGRFPGAHDCVSDAPLIPVFQSLPGASFIVNGVVPAQAYVGVPSFGSPMG